MKLGNVELGIVDAILGFFIVFGVVMTAINFFAMRGPTSEIIDSEIHEITPAPPPAHKQFGQPIALFTTAQQSQIPPTPYRMGDWAECRDGAQFYIPRSMADPCLEHGGLRAYAPGKRLNEE